MIWYTSDTTCDIVQQVRDIVGDSDPLKRVAGTIRGDFSSSRRENCIHASDSVEAAQREITIWSYHIFNLQGVMA